MTDTATEGTTEVAPAPEESKETPTEGTTETPSKESE